MSFRFRTELCGKRHWTWYNNFDDKVHSRSIKDPNYMTPFNGVGRIPHWSKNSEVLQLAASRFKSLLQREQQLSWWFQKLCDLGTGMSISLLCVLDKHSILTKFLFGQFTLWLSPVYQPLFWIYHMEDYMVAQRWRSACSRCHMTDRCSDGNHTAIYGNQKVSSIVILQGNWVFLFNIG